MANNYSMQGYEKENMARAIGRSLPISFKFGVEICNFIRNKSVNDAKKALSNAIGHKQAIPFRRFNTNLGHKRKIGPGRYPEKASMAILDLINSVEANAQFKGLNTSKLVITHISTNNGPKVMHAGRKRSRKAKRINVEIVVQEKMPDKKYEAIAANKGAKAQEKEMKQSKKQAGKDKK